MKLKYHVVCLLLGLATNLLGQLQGVVMLEDVNQPAGRAQVFLIDSSRQFIDFCISDNAGGFEVACKQAGEVRRVIQYVGYESDTLLIDCKQNLDRTDTVFLRQSAITLANAVLLAKRSLYTQRGDTAVFDTEGLVTKHGTSAGELLNRLPGLAYDPNAGLTFRGQQVSNVLVDGDDGISNSPSTVLRSLKGMDIAEVKAYEAIDSTSLTAKNELTVDLILSEAGRKRLRGDLDVGASLRDYLVEGSTYRVGKSKFLAYVYSSDVDRIPFSYGDYNGKVVSSPRNRNIIVLPSLFQFNRRVSSISNTAVELSGVAKGKHISVQGFGAVYVSGDSMKIQTLTSTDDLSIRAFERRANQVSDVRGQLVIKSDISPKSGLTATLGGSTTSELSNTAFQTSFDTLTSLANQVSDTRHDVLDQYIEFDFRNSKKHLFKLGASLLYTKNIDSLRIHSDQELPGSTRRSDARLVEHQQVNYGLDIMNVYRSNTKWSYSTKFSGDIEPLFFEVNNELPEEYGQHRFRISQVVNYSKARSKISGEVGYALVHRAYSSPSTNRQLVARLNATGYTSNASKLSFTVERYIEPVRAEWPQADSIRRDVQTFIVPYQLTPPTAASYGFEVKAEQPLPSGRGMRLVNGRLDIGENFSELSIFDQGALYLQPIRYERGLRALVFLFQSVKFNKSVFYRL